MTAVASVVLSALALLGGITFWAGRIVGRLDAINETLKGMGARQQKVEDAVAALDVRLARLESAR